MLLSSAIPPHLLSDSAPVAAPGASITLHAALRDGTRRGHQRIEQLLAIHVLATSCDLSTDNALRAAQRLHLRRVLRTLASFQRQWQPKVRAALAPALHSWLDESPRLDWLAQDLAALGDPIPTAPASADADVGADHDPCADLALPDALSALASLYVVEGSALGGQVISRSLGGQPALAPALRYFQGHGEHTGARWRRFCDLLAQAEPAVADRAASGPARWQVAVQAANATFDALCCAALQQQDAILERGVAA